MDEIYRTKVFSSGGRNGHVKSDDGIIDIDLSTPKTMGGKRDATNPEQLFAAGYAACFEHSMQHIARSIALPVKATAVEAEVAMYKTLDEEYRMSVTLKAFVKGIDQEAADDLVKRAHDICPYSGAVKNNVDVSMVAQVVA